jgi:hypothetical protein
VAVAVVRKLPIVTIGASVVALLVGFDQVAATRLPSPCYQNCFAGANRKLLLIPAGFIGILASLLLANLVDYVHPRGDGPKSFDAVRAGQTGMDEAAAAAGGVRSVRPWTEAWRNLYAAAGAFELLLTAFFVYEGVKRPAARGPILATGGMLGLLGLALLFLGYRTAAKNRLHASGLAGRAEIASVEQTGVWLSRNPVVVLGLNVQLEGVPVYRVRHRETVPQTMVGRLAVGQTVPVRVNPHHPSDLIIEWEQP